jgi:hypothetical protein
MADLSGLDVGYKIRKGKQLTEESDITSFGGGRGRGRGRGTRYSRIGDELFLLGRLGVKNGKGFYRYTAKKTAAYIGTADNEVEGVIECETIRRNSLLGTVPHSIPPYVLEPAVDEGARERVGELITQRLLYPLINEAFKLLEQGGAVSGRPGDIDIVFLKGSNTAKRFYVVSYVFHFSLFSPLIILSSFLHFFLSSSFRVLGYGWPSIKGGPLFYADRIVTLPLLLCGLEAFAKQFPESEYYEPSELLRAMVAENISILDLQHDKNQYFLNHLRGIIRDSDNELPERKMRKSFL